MFEQEWRRARHRVFVTILWSDALNRQKAEERERRLIVVGTSVIEGHEFIRSRIWYCWLYEGHYIPTRVWIIKKTWRANYLIWTVNATHTWTIASCPVFRPAQ